MHQTRWCASCFKTPGLRSGLSPGQTGIAPDACFHVSGSGGEQSARWTWGDGDDRVLVTLEHHLSRASVGIPELDSTVLGSRHDPITIGGQAHREDIVLATS